MPEPTMTELRRMAKARGINSFGMKKTELKAALGDEGPSNDPRASRPTSREDDAPRRRRVPLGTAQLKLEYPSREGYVRRWFNDRGNRIHAAQAAGYEFVEENSDGRRMRVSRRVGTHEDGAPMNAYLMEIRQEFYDEDQAEKQKVNDAIDDAIMRRETPEQAASQDRGAFYTPSEGRSMNVET